MIRLVLNIGVRRLMRAGQITALLVVLVEAQISLDFPWSETGNVAENPEGFGIFAVLVALLVMSEFVIVGRLTSVRSLVWLGFIARFSGLGWAGTAFVAAVAIWIIPGASDGATPIVLLWIAGGLALVVSFYAFTIGRTRIVVRNFTLTPGGAHPSSSGSDVGLKKPTRFRITALSDLHLGEFVTAAQIRRAVEVSNAESPDIVLLLGDYVDDDGSLGAELVAELTLLKAKLGVFAVLGNHDVKCRDARVLVGELARDQTISLLMNSSANVRVGSESDSKVVQIVGIQSPGDWWFHDSDEFGRKVLRTELADSEADYTIVASHHPEVFAQAAKESVDLVVSGHTHGGQLAVPFTGRLLNVGRLVATYFWGLYELGSTRLVITAGIGVGVIPARIGVPPEVTVIDVSLD